jgi:hypothetical protein
MHHRRWKQCDKPTLIPANSATPLSKSYKLHNWWTSKVELHIVTLPVSWCLQSGSSPTSDSQVICTAVLVYTQARPRRWFRCAPFAASTTARTVNLAFTPLESHFSLIKIVLTTPLAFHCPALHGLLLRLALVLSRLGRTSRSILSNAARRIFWQGTHCFGGRDA